MSLYNDVICDIKRQEVAKEQYRFQGGNSFECFDIKTSKFVDSSRDSYVYLSNSLDHHKYFTIKRIRQLLNKQILKEEELQISCKDLRNNDTYPRIKNLVLNSEKLQDMYSVCLLCDNNAVTLMKENSFPQNKKIIGKSLERVDRRVYGGGFGVASEWKDLLTCLTYFNGYQRIDRNSIITLLANMRTSGRVNNKENIEFLFTNPSYYHFEPSPKLESDFTKYEIINALEQILENSTYSPESTLAENPNKTIKKVVEDYERGREKVLTLLNKHCNDKIN